jgi:hypothetical protein
MTDDTAKDNGWTESVYEVCESWMYRAANVEKQYHLKLQKAIRRYNFVHCTYIVLSTIGGSISFYNANSFYQLEGTSGAVFWLNLIVALVQVSAGGLATWEAFRDFPTQVQYYKYAQGKFGRIVRLLELTINAADKFKPNANEFMKDVSERFWKYQEKSNSPSQEIVQIIGTGSSALPGRRFRKPGDANPRPAVPAPRDSDDDTSVSGGETDDFRARISLPLPGLLKKNEPEDDDDERDDDNGRPEELSSSTVSLPTDLREVVVK